MGNDDCAGLPQGTHALAGAWSSGRGDTPPLQLGHDTT